MDALPFSDQPGRRERHLRCRHANPLFGWPPPRITLAELTAAQQADRAESAAWQASFRALVQRAAALPPDANSDTVLAIKENLEQHYEQLCGLGTHERAQQHKTAIQRLIHVISQAVWRQVANDPIAQQELRTEETARTLHYRLLEHPLIADILYPQTLMTATDLLPTLLTVTPAAAAAAAEIFDPEQLQSLVTSGYRLLAQLRANEVDVTHAEHCLAMLQLRLDQYDLTDDSAY